MRQFSQHRHEGLETEATSRVGQRTQRTGMHAVIGGSADEDQAAGRNDGTAR